MEKRFNQMVTQLEQKQRELAVIAKNNFQKYERFVE